MTKPALAVDDFAFDPQRQGSHPASLAVDPTGSVWVGMQDWAVWNWSLDANGLSNWRQFTIKDGLGDNDAYAVAADHRGRVWVGHLNHGVSVWNGASWKNYGVTDGPQGERIFDIAVCPTDGDVWIASDSGLARYSDAHDKWSYFSRVEGLSADQVNAIAFDKKGNIYCGTQADGLTLAHAAKNYTDWRAVRANTQMPRSAKGAGLPSNIVNDVLVAHGTPTGVGAGIVYAATVNGLAWSRDEGVSWQFVRGNDWRANLAGRYVKTAPIDVEVDEDELLLQDWVTCLTEDRRGMVWVGHLRKGFEARDPRTMHTTFASAETPLVSDDEDFVRTMIDTPAAGLLVGRYGNPVNPGVFSLRKHAAAPDEAAVVPLPSVGALPRFPSPAAPPDTAQLNAMTERLRQLKAPLQPGDAAFLGDDWATQGDWVGRYGRGHATLAAMDGGANETFKRLGNSPDHVLDGAPGYSVSEQNGPHDKAGTVPWITWTTTDIQRALYDPLIGHRRHAEWNDLSNFLNMYPWEWEGPDIWVTVRVPAGMHRASIYCYNKDGQRGHDRYRDFPIEVKRAPAEVATLENLPVRPSRPMRRTTKTDLAQIDATPTLARARVSDFWGGVYKQFALCGPGTFYFKVARNHSNGVLVSGVFLDPMTNPKQLQQPAKPLSWMNGVIYDAPKIEPALGEDETQNPGNHARLLAAQTLWNELDIAAWKKSGLGAQRPMRLQALRAAMASGASPSLIANWRWQLGLWNDADRTQWQTTMDRAFPVKIF